MKEQDRQAALAALDELDADQDYLFGRVAVDGSVAGAMAKSVRDKLKTIRAALTAQQPEAPRYDPRLGLIQKEPINQELLEAATKLDAELNRRNSYDCQLKTSQVLSDSWPAIKRAIALTAQLTKTDDNVSCPNIANAGDINAELLEACNVALGHMTGGMDGDWRDCDPITLLREAIARAKQKGGE